MDAHKIASVLKALLLGRRVKCGDQTLLLSEDFDLCVVGHDSRDEEVLLRSHASLAGFIRLADKLTEAQWVALAAGMALTKVR